MRWLILHLCVTRAEVRLVLRALSRRYQARLEPREVQPGTLDKRITRNFRLALLIGLLTVHAENPRLAASAIVVLPVAIVLLALWLAGLLR
ncbi:hypothetical protein [Trinickia symbiotica]|uniref:hypothetical protein n=1 Tax=Trinickia symbiotica TaxID=863227 RepID=UPI002687C516